MKPGTICTCYKIVIKWDLKNCNIDVTCGIIYLRDVSMLKSRLKHQIEEKNTSVKYSFYLKLFIFPAKMRLN